GCVLLRDALLAVRCGLSVSARSRTCRSWRSHSTVSIFARPATSSACSVARPRCDAHSFWPSTSSRTPSEFAIASFSWPEEKYGGLARSRNCGCKRGCLVVRWRRSFLRLPRAYCARAVRLSPLLAKELAEIL